MARSGKAGWFRRRIFSRRVVITQSSFDWQLQMTGQDFLIESNTFGHRGFYELRNRLAHGTVRKKGLVPQGFTLQLEYEREI